MGQRGVSTPESVMAKGLATAGAPRPSRRPPLPHASGDREPAHLGDPGGDL